MTSVFNPTGTSTDTNGLVLIETKTLAATQTTTTFSAFAAYNQYLLVCILNADGGAGSERIGIQVNGVVGAVYYFAELDHTTGLNANVAAASAWDWFSIDSNNYAGWVLLQGNVIGGGDNLLTIGAINTDARGAGTEVSLISGQVQQAAASDLTSITVLRLDAARTFTGILSLYGIPSV